MSSVPIEQERFKAYLDYPKRPGSIVHPPSGVTSSFSGFTTPCLTELLNYTIYLPYHWEDEQRIHQVATYITYIELGYWRLSALDLIRTPQPRLPAHYATLLEIANRLIAPRPWVEAMTKQFGTHRDALQQAAHSISIPWTSMHTVLNRPLSREAGYREAIDLMIAALMDVILSLKEAQTPLDRATCRAAIEDAERQISELETYRDGLGLEGKQPEPHHLE